MAFIGVEGADLTQQSLELGEQPLDGIDLFSLDSFPRDVRYEVCG
jgi:hypothetical protein